MAQEEAPEGAQVVVRAGEFARTNLRVDRAGWGDTQPVLLNDEQYPNFAEHDFDAAEAGFYEIHALYAAEQSRPVDLHVDGRLVFRAGLAGTTGSFKASSARWERAGLVYLSAGRHTLRLERAACVPHVAAVALRRDPNLMPETALEQLPPEALVRDNFPIQDWILWATGGTQEYQVRDGAFVIRNGRHTFNRPLFASMGSTGSMGSVGSQPAPTPPHLPYSPYLGIVAFAGDRPQWLLAEIDTAKLGILSLAVGDRWLHQAAGIESAYDAGRMTHTVGDPALAGGTLAITTLRLPGSAGCILRLDASRPMEVRWVFGGLRGNFSTDWAGSGGWQAGLHPEDAAGNHIELRDGTAFVTSPDLPDRVAAVAASGGPAQVVHLAEGAPDTLFATPPGQRPAAGGVLALNGEPAYLVVVAGRAAHPPAAEQTPSAEPAPRRLAGTSDTPAPNPNAAGTPDTPAPHPSAASAPDNRNTRNHAVDSPPPLRPGETLASLRENPDPRLGETFASLRESPADLFRSAEDAWRARAGRLEVRTPVPELDAAARSNNASLDGIWRPPSFLHGAVRWGSGGWYLGWRGWYGPICAGDLDRVREAIRFHARHQIEEPAAGVQSRGAFAGFVHFDGAQDRCGYDMNQVFLDHIRSYYAWSGDLETIREVWPAVKRCLEYERRQMDPDGDGLYTNNLNTFISDGHHYDGGGCTQSSAYMHSILRFAADAAARLGEDPVPYRREAEKIRAAVQRFLWRERAGTFAEYRDTDGVLHDAAEAPTIYHAVEFGLADPLQAVRATEYLSRRLWWDLGFRISDFGSAAGRTAAPSGSPGGRRRGDPAPASPHREAAATG